MKQSGVAETGSPVDPLFIRIKTFISQFCNSDSDTENINNHKTKLAVAMSEFQARTHENLIVISNHSATGHHYNVHGDHIKSHRGNGKLPDGLNLPRG
jgi:hypothetical protein